LASGQNPYPIVEAIQKTVLEATAESAVQAEKEWQHAAHSRDMRALTPAINAKPISGVVEIVVRASRAQMIVIHCVPSYSRPQ